VRNEWEICGYNSACIMRPQLFVAVCELTSIHDGILSTGQWEW